MQTYICNLDSICFKACKQLIKLKTCPGLLVGECVNVTALNKLPIDVPQSIKAYADTLSLPIIKVEAIGTLRLLIGQHKK